MTNRFFEFIKGARGSSQTRLVVLVTAALTVIGVAVFAAQPWGGNNAAQAENPPRICDFFPDYFLCSTQTSTQTWTPSNTPTITNTPTQTPTPTNTLTPTNTPTFIPKLGAAEPKAIIAGGTGGELLSANPALTTYVPMGNGYTSLAVNHVQNVMPGSGAITHFQVRLDQPPLLSDGYRVYLWKNQVPTAMGCDVIGDNGQCSDKSHCVDFAEGDLINVAAVAIGSPNLVTLNWSALFFGNASCP